MSQEQPRRPQSEGGDPIKYGDVFYVHGDLASKPIAPQDAAAMQAAENRVLGETPKGGPAAAMQSAARVNVVTGLVDSNEANDMVTGGDTSVSEISTGVERIITENVAGQVVAQYIEPRVPMTSPGSALGRDAITIGEALEAAAVAAGDKPVEQSDAAAIQAAEVRATGLNETLPGGVGAQAQSAATLNPEARCGKDKATLSDVLEDATMKLPGERAVSREDAQGVIEAEIRNKPDMRTAPGGVAASVAAAARLNQNK